MRVATITFGNNLVSQLADLNARQTRLQTQAATGQRVQFPDDDPAAMRRVMALQSEARTVLQFQRNVTTQQDLAQANLDTVRALQRVASRVGEIATLADDTRSPDDLQAYAVEVGQLLQQALQLANTRYRDQYLLAGTRSDQPPFQATYAPDGSMSSVSYQGNTNVARVQVAESIELSAQLVGANSSDTGPQGVLTDQRAGADFFGHLISLYQHLKQGDTAAISATDLPQLGRDEDNLTRHLGGIGATQSHLEAILAVSRQRHDRLENLVSNEADADLADTLMRLNETQNAYRAALQSGASILDKSLLDFLR